MIKKQKEKLEVYFVTSNSGKVQSLQASLDKLNAPVTVKQYTMKLDEIQADDPEEISQQKARDAFKELKKPLVVEDSGFCINALNGFPGVYTHFILETIGADGIIKLMEGKLFVPSGEFNVRQASFVPSIVTPPEFLLVLTTTSLLITSPESFTSKIVLQTSTESFSCIKGSWFSCPRVPAIFARAVLLVLRNKFL